MRFISSNWLVLHISLAVAIKTNDELSKLRNPISPELAADPRDKEDTAETEKLQTQIEPPKTMQNENSLFVDEPKRQSKENDGETVSEKPKDLGTISDIPDKTSLNQPISAVAAANQADLPVEAASESRNSEGGVCNATESDAFLSRRAYNSLIKACVGAQPGKVLLDCASSTLKSLSDEKGSVNLDEGECATCWKDLVQSVGSLDRKTQQICRSAPTEAKCTGIIKDEIAALKRCTGMTAVYRNGASTITFFTLIVMLIFTYILYSGLGC